MDARFLAYVGVMALLIVIPGPDMLMVARTVLRNGRPAASLTSFGIGIGSAVWACASVIGIALLLERSVLAFTVLKLAGAVYLGYLGLRSLLGRSAGGARAPMTAAAAPLKPIRARTALAQGLLSNLLNPKAGAIFATVMPQFIRPGDSPLRFAMMVLAYETILLVWLYVYAAAIGRAGRSRTGAQVRRWFERVAGAVLIGLGVRLAFERR